MSTTTKIVYRLKDEGLVETYSCEDDARITRVFLTEKGMQMTHKINDLTNIVLEQSFEGLTPLQIEKTMERLRHIFKNLARSKPYFLFLNRRWRIGILSIINNSPELTKNQKSSVVGWLFRFFLWGHMNIQTLLPENRVQ